MKKVKVVAIVGPTASGKTNLAIEVAKRFSGEIISADSRQVYRGLDIGTGKVTKEEMQGVPHHLIDVADVNVTYNVADFVHDTDLAINRINKRGHLPIIAGGTFFYLDQVRRKAGVPAVPPNPELRKELETKTAKALFEALKALDPERAANVDPHNKRRLIRALEIIDTLGKVPASKAGASPYEWLIIGTKIDKEELRKKFRKRLLSWLEVGLIEEVTDLKNSDLSPERFSELGFEYTLTSDFIDGKFENDVFIQKFVEKNWQYAKRQMTWLKRDSEIEWYPPENLEEILGRIETFLHQE